MRDSTRFCILFSFLVLFLSYQTFPQTHIPTKENFIYSQPVFENISTSDKLPENSGVCLLQDYLGYLWIVTQNGVARYDGYSIKIFELEEGEGNSISTSGPSIYEDKNKNLWIGTTVGLNKFDRTKEVFKFYGPNKDDTLNGRDYSVRSFCEDKAGRFWMGTQIGLNLFDIEKETFTSFHFINVNKSTSPYREFLPVNAIIEDPSTGDLLIGTEQNGLWKFNIKEKIFFKYSPANLDKKIDRIQSFCKSRDGKIWMASTHTLSSFDPYKKSFQFYIDIPTTGDEQNITFSIPIGFVIEDQEGLIWSGFYKGEKGVFSLDPKTGDLKNYNLFPDKPRMARYNKILSLYEDRTGIIWIGTWLAGVIKLDKRKNRFQQLYTDPGFSPNGLASSLVYSGIYDPNGYIWFCTQKSLDKYDIKNKTYKHYLKDEDCITKYFYQAIQDKDGYIWLGTANCGLIRFDPQNESYRFYLNDAGRPINLVNKQVRTFTQDQHGNLWIGTEGFGLYRFDIKNNITNVFTNIPGDSSSLGQNQIKSIYEDRYGNLWVGTNLAGLDKFNNKTENFSHHGFESISVLYEDKQGNFWVGDYYSGLNLYNRERALITATYSRNEGLANPVFREILEDDKNNLWIQTETGFFKFNTITRTFRHYYIDDGLPEWIQLESFSFKGPEGKIYFNSNKGQIVFHPDSIKDDPNPPKVLLTGLSLFNRPEEKLNYEGFISELKEVTIPYDQNDLRFDFVGLHFSSPQKNQYKYILENFDKGWIDAEYQRQATYTNLSPGEYIFKVTASNKDGVWNKEDASIKIIITPPWYQTTLAYLLYILFIAGLIYLVWKAQLRRIRIKNEYEMSKFEAQKLHEVDELKSRFFTNISHEFRTPLTLILGPVKQVMERIKDDKNKDELRIAHKNANKLLGLVNQLLDISKIESGNMKLSTSPINYIQLLKALTLSFASYAERKSITLKFNSTEDEIILYLDRDKIEKIITNILSNAFKFTPEGGRIEVTLHKDDKYVNTIISDTGIGISKEKIPKIFDRFYQVDGSHTREQEGTGIGLALTKELVDLHKGKIEVESEESKGTTFTISIPLGKEHLMPEEISEIEKEYTEDKSILELEDDITRKEERKIDIELFENESLPLLLIVEDNSDVRKYIKDNLTKEFRTLEAVDGEDGWNKSIEQIPDLIISDVMMPKMDGFKLCEKLKTDERTSHIPVILLTAKASKEDKLAGYETGADEYLMKPFEPDELRARIKNLIEQRKRVQEYFRKQGLIGIDQQKITSVDKRFLQRSFDIINKHISNSLFSVQMLAEELAISHSGLQKKIQSLIGETPGDLIRRIRLNKAAVLIRQKFGNLSEIALEVGYNNPSHFSNAFKRQFGTTPSQFLQNNNIN